MQEKHEVSSALAAMFKAAGDAMRLDILRIMKRESYGVLELCSVFDVQQPSMSHHLKVLAKAGLVSTRREGNSIFYRRASIAGDHSHPNLDLFYRLIDLEPINGSLAAELLRVKSSRHAQAAEFFEANAHRFREQQDLIAGHKDYGELVADMLARDSASSWIEIGPGDGELLKDCAADFRSVLALDISNEMLDQSRRALSEAFSDETAQGVTFELGEARDLLARGVSADVVSCNMVLHHVPSPADMVVAMGSLLAPGGQLLITDLHEHDQDWAREACGDLWLGFAPDQLNEWAAHAGLKEGRSDFLALRNGFGVQIREYLK